jgi:hypothetical protein
MIVAQRTAAALQRLAVASFSLVRLPLDVEQLAEIVDRTKCLDMVPAEQSFAHGQRLAKVRLGLPIQA